MNILYKLLMGMGLCAALFLSGLVYGLHGKAAAVRDAKNAIAATLNQQAATQLQQALDKQSAETRIREQRTEMLLRQALDSKDHADLALENFRKQLQALQDEPDQTWLKTPIPAGISRLLNSPSDQSNNSPRH